MTRTRIAGDFVASGSRGSVYFEPNGYAVNMAYVVRKGSNICYRGPQWRAHMGAHTGIPYAEQWDGRNL
jgi:hypothetical protein